MKELGLKERACKNMLANALDMEDQHRFVFSILLNSIFFYLYSTSLITSFFIFFDMDDQHMFVYLIFFNFSIFDTFTCPFSTQVGSFSFLFVWTWMINTFLI